MKPVRSRVMADSKLKIDIRRNKILERLRRDGSIRVSELSSELGVTSVTLRTDLDSLEQDGYLERVQGGAILKVRTEERLSLVSEDSGKIAIGQKAAQHICDGSTLFINSGTTTRCVATALKQHKNINVVTNSIAVAMELKEISSIHVILLGGEVNSQYAFTYGEDAKNQLLHYQADWAILSVDGISSEAGITTFHADEAMIDRMMIERAQKTLIVADHSKIGRVGFTCIRTLDAGVELITDCKSTEETLKTMEKEGLKIILT